MSTIGINSTTIAITLIITPASTPDADWILVRLSIANCQLKNA